MQDSVKLSSADAALFVKAGDAIFTVRSVRTGTRFTFRVTVCEDRPELFFVKVLTGSDNSGDYQYLGTIRDGVWAHGRKSRITPDAPSARAFAWLAPRLLAGIVPADVEIFHEGRCGRCARRLTVPESVARGIGPECAGMLECV